MLVAAWAAGLGITSIAAPIAEDLNFRGFPLPRLEHLGPWAPVRNAALFAVYHL